MSEHWYYSSDQEAYFDGGWTKEEAIKHGRDHYSDGEPYWIARGCHQEYQTNLFDEIAEHFDDKNYDLSGDDYASGKWAEGDQQEISQILEKAFSEWLTRKGYNKSLALQLLEEHEVPATEAWHIWDETGKWPDNKQ